MHDKIPGLLKDHYLLVKFNKVSKLALFAAAICSGVNVMISPSKLRGEQ